MPREFGLLLLLLLVKTESHELLKDRIPRTFKGSVAGVHNNLPPLGTAIRVFLCCVLCVVSYIKVCSQHFDFRSTPKGGQTAIGAITNLLSRRYNKQVFLLREDIGEG